MNTDQQAVHLLIIHPFLNSSSCFDLVLVPTSLPINTPICEHICCSLGDTNFCPGTVHMYNINNQ